MIDKTRRSFSLITQNSVENSWVAGLAATFGSGAVVAQTDDEGKNSGPSETAGGVVDSADGGGWHSFRRQR